MTRLEELSAEFSSEEGALSIYEMHELCVLQAAEIERLQSDVKRTAPIIAERDRQDAKWGSQDHTLPEWITILMEEVGELAAASLCHLFGNANHPELDWRKEAIQVAAVALSMVEQYRPPENPR